jgi:hypothetical protein
MSSSATPKYRTGDRVEKGNEKYVVVRKYLDVSTDKWIYRVRNKATSEISVEKEEDLKQ